MRRIYITLDFKTIIFHDLGHSIWRRKGVRSTLLQVSQETGDRIQDTGERGQEKGDRREE